MTTEATPVAERLLWHVEQVCGPLSTEVCEVPGDDDRSILAHNFAAVIATALADMQRRVDELEAENAALRRVIHVSKGPSPENVEIVQSAFDRGWSIPLDPPEWPEMLAQAQEFLAARQALSDKAKDKNDG